VSEEYLEISINEGNKKSSLQISNNHMVFIRQKNNHVAVPASDLQIGDQLLVNNNNTNGIVTDIRQVKSARGAYAPFTPSGKLYVNDIMVSSYVAILNNDDYYLPTRTQFHHWIAHASQFPHRVMCYYFSNNNNNRCALINNNDNTKISASFYSSTMWMLQQPFFVRILFLSMGTLLALFFHIFEVYYSICFFFVIAALLRRYNFEIIKQHS